MAIASNFPAIKPSLSLDFANTKRLDSRVTFTRTTTATYYDGVTTAMAEQNLLLQSQDFTTTWTNVRSTDVANTNIAPDGTTTADSLLQASGQTTYGGVTQNATVVAGDYVLSVFAKPNGKNFLVMLEQLLDGTSRTTWFNVSTGTVGTTNAGHTATISAAANSYYRCSIKFTADASRTAAVIFYNADTDGSTVVTDSGGLFIWGAQLEQRSSVTSYTATTTQPITNYIPVLLTAASGVARFDHNPTTDESLGLLIEEARTNTCLQSENFSTTWSATRATLSTNSRVSPAGTLTADKLIATTDNNTHFVAQTFTGTAASWTFTVYAKAVDYSFVALRLFNGTSQVGLAYYNLSTGATATVTAGTASIQSVGNGWYRCALTATLAASASCTADIQLASADNTNSFAGNDWNGISIWGAQLEAGAFPTSYIATTAATVTRNADAASMTGSNFTSWFNNAEGTLYADINPMALAAPNGVVINDNTTSNRIRLATTSVSDQGTVTVSGTAQATLDGGTPAANTNMKLAMTYQANNFALSLNGASAVTDTSGTVPVVSQLQIGSETTTVGNLQIKKIAYYPIASTATQLQALTS